MNEIELDFHDEESSFDTDLEALDLDYQDILDDSDEEVEKEKELIFYRRLDDY